MVERSTARPTVLAVGRGGPRVEAAAFLGPSATVVGAVTLAEGSSVWYGAVLRGDVETIDVGPDSNIQDNCTLHADPGFPVVLGARVSVGHNAVLHGCTLEDEVLVGMGATVLNGARIGAGSLVAAQALVPQGMVVPPGSLVAGVPAKVRRELTGAEREDIRRNAAGYRELAGVHHAAQAGSPEVPEEGSATEG